jgi:KEOPS complex subunit Cgi121
MSFTPATIDIRAAYCTITDRSAFLRDLRTVATDHNTHIICFNADMIAGRVHAVAAITQAVRAFNEGLNISNTLEMESLLYAAGSRQCNIAASFGIHDGENRTWVCCFPQQEKIWLPLKPLFQDTQEDWDTIDHERKKRLVKTFSISSEEIEAAGGDRYIVNLVLERVALLQVLK